MLRQQQGPRCGDELEMFSDLQLDPPKSSSGEVTGMPLGVTLGAAFCCEGDSGPDQVFLVQERGNHYAGRVVRSLP